MERLKNTSLRNRLKSARERKSAVEAKRAKIDKKRSILGFLAHAYDRKGVRAERRRNKLNHRVDRLKSKIGSSAVNNK